MIEKKLDALFKELNEEEINMIENSEINTGCDIDPKNYSAVLARVRAKTHEEIEKIPVVSTKEKETVMKQVRGKKFKALLIAAAVFIVLAIGTGAAYQFILPDGLNEQLELHEMNIRTVVDVEKADENSVRTVQKTVHSNGYTVNFEAIIDGYIILPEMTKKLRGLDTTREFREDRIYAVMTITRDDGKSVLEPDGYMPGCSCCSGITANFCVAVKGYAPNSGMFATSPWHYEENNIMYLLCDITDAAKFADHELSIIVYDNTHLDGTIARMDKNGDYYFVDTYDRIGAIFDFDLDDSFADPEAVAKDMELNHWFYDTDPDYTIYDEMIAKEQALKKIDLSYAIGNHRWNGWDPLQFGEIPYAQTFIDLFAKKSSLAKTDIELFNAFIEKESLRLDAAVVAEVERMTGKKYDDLTNDEINSISDEVNGFIEENERVRADSLRENLSFVKLSDGSEYCYIDEFVFLYIPAGSEYAQIVIVYGDRIVISLECNVDNMRNLAIWLFNGNTDEMPGIMYAYWYLFGVDNDSRYAKFYNEDDYKMQLHTIRSEQDAIFFLIQEFSYYEGTVEVIRK